jgi:hypothetical protein
MNTRHCLKIAERMDALLLPELGQGVDSLRMVAEPLYARDVLLVCDAMPGTELAQLARQYRVAATEPAQVEATPSRAAPGGPVTRPAAGQGRDGRGAARASPDTGAGNSSGFGTNMWSRLVSGFGFGPSTLDSQPAASGRADGKLPPRRGLSPLRKRTGSRDPANDPGQDEK